MIAQVTSVVNHPFCYVQMERYLNGENIALTSRTGKKLPVLTFGLIVYRYVLLRRSTKRQIPLTARETTVARRKVVMMLMRSTVSPTIT